MQKNTVMVETVEDAIAAARTGSARIPYAALGEMGENALADHAITVRCLQSKDGELPSTTDSLDNLEAVVARSY